MAAWFPGIRIHPAPPTQPPPLHAGKIYEKWPFTQKPRGKKAFSGGSGLHTARPNGGPWGQAKGGRRSGGTGRFLSSGFYQGALPARGGPPDRGPRPCCKGGAGAWGTGGQDRGGGGGETPGGPANMRPGGGPGKQAYLPLQGTKTFKGRKSIKREGRRDSSPLLLGTYQTSFDPFRGNNFGHRAGGEGGTFTQIGPPGENEVPKGRLGWTAGGDGKFSSHPTFARFGVRMFRMGAPSRQKGGGNWGTGGRTRRISVSGKPRAGLEKAQGRNLKQSRSRDGAGPPFFSMAQEAGRKRWGPHQGKAP